ncbi:hypothetical protein BOSE62_30254 [Bosea sp. 62]|nr:hypothetical protein BOSE46_130278 [Bosea sp. 46]CAD5267741.1 hypothetical protein BOSE21B_111368 [Bosea sp. 21B]CAD5271222.1 hypothetical protein BOSE7B_30027 [Bosea sp. 7B]VVT55590.1 hypothetical protein BOS5A_120026 [Bosea sp. EC-HK365B]VXB87857.1 hypothetical protein BOSE29B_130208 [Bosea sp. 29B]VXC15720.1 hypothetical protein BOSE62_30254 [Bosea sp. 62]VXC26588.1 hypothetical protein BOSE125_180333 [Bosea sp. 125]VXC67538.1 hypothetical protein BOSE127_40026 [Bosea sp. 127]
MELHIPALPPPRRGPERHVENPGGAAGIVTRSSLAQLVRQAVVTFHPILPLAECWNRRGGILQARLASATNSGPLPQLHNRKGFNSPDSKGDIALAAFVLAQAIVCPALT